MDTMVSQITSLTIVYSIVYSGTDQRKHWSSASLDFVRGIHRWPVNSPHKWPVTQKMFPFDYVIMIIILFTYSQFFSHYQLQLQEIYWDTVSLVVNIYIHIYIIHCVSVIEACKPQLLALSVIYRCSYMYCVYNDLYPLISSCTLFKKHLIYIVTLNSFPWSLSFSEGVLSKNIAEMNNVLMCQSI